MRDPKLLVCETMAAIVLHLRVDDGEPKLGGGLDPSLMLCGGCEATNGWDTRIPSPATPDEARAVTQAPRYCQGCITVWEEKLTDPTSKPAASAPYKVGGDSNVPDRTDEEEEDREPDH